MAVWTAEEKQNFRNAHPCIMPVCQPNHNSPHADLKAYFDNLFNADHSEYKGMVTVATIKEGAPTPTIVAVVPAAEMGTWASKMHVSSRTNYYYSKAQHRGSATWGMDGAFCYNAIYVDIDAHNADCIDGDTTINAICYALPDEGIPTPNVVELSGRGYHLIWYAEQIAASLNWMVEAVSAHFAQTIQGLLNANGYCVDTSYARNIAGLTRIPGTRNTASGTYSSYQILHHSRLDIPKAFDSIPHYKSNAYSISSTNATTSKRLEALLRLHIVRPIQVSQRDVYCLHLFSAAQYAGMSNQDALALVQSVNHSFDVPLSEREVECYLSSAARKHYKFTLSRVISDLDIALSEQEAIGLHTRGKRDSNRARNARVAAKRQKRDRVIMRLHLLGLSPTAIAEKIKHAYNTIRSVIRKYTNRLSEIFSEKELHNIRKQRIRAAVAALKATFQKSKPYILCLYVALSAKCCLNVSSRVFLALGNTDTLIKPPGI